MSDDFTTGRYRELLTAALARFRFIRFGDGARQRGIALWRHDIDFSPQRALALARMEHELGAAATYFVQLSSRYYSVFEPETAAVLREISTLGHDVGLHFDAEVLGHHAAPDYERRLSFEAGVLEQTLERPVSSFSLHNAMFADAGLEARADIGGLVNASHRTMQEDFSYCSDSNGLWRHRSLADVLVDPDVTRLYALTHPEWWQDTAMSPRRRIQRCIDGRARHAAQYYDALLERCGRPNVGRES